MSEEYESWDKLRPADLLVLEDFGGTNASILLGLLRFRSVIDSGWAVRNIAQPVSSHPRFRSRLNKQTAKFELYPAFEASSQVTDYGKPLTSEELNRLASNSMPFNRPLWHVHVFPDNRNEATDVVFQVHHVIGDGAGLIRLFLSTVFTPSDNRTVRTAQNFERCPLHRELVVAGAQPTVFDSITRPIRDVYTYFIGSLIGDAPNPLNRRPATMSGSKRVAFARERNVSELRNASRRVGITINDLLLAALTGALRSLYPTNSMNVAVPKFMEHKGGQLYNAASLYIVNLPLYLRSRTHRIASCTRSMRDCKAGIGLILCLFLIQVLYFVPELLRRMLLNRITHRVTLGFTNVPGSSTPMKCGDRDIEGAGIVVRGLGACGLILTAFSYLDTLQVSLCADICKLDKPETLMNAFDAELDKILEWIDRAS